MWEQTRVSDENFQSIVAALRYVGYSPEVRRGGYACMGSIYLRIRNCVVRRMKRGIKYYLHPWLPPSLLARHPPRAPSHLCRVPYRPSQVHYYLFKDYPPIQSTLPLIQSTVPHIQNALLPDANGEIFVSMTAQNAYSQHSFEVRSILFKVGI